MTEASNVMARRAESARAAGTVSFAVLISRVLGLAREQVFAHYFGANLYNDAWRVAYRIPGLLRDLFAEGALSSAFIPTFSDYLRNKGRQEAFLLGSLVANALLALLGVFMLALLLAPQAFVFLMAEGFSEIPGKFEVTSSLLRILSPFLVFVAIASVAMGMLNTLDRYFLPALAPALFNAAIILAGIFLVPIFERHGQLPIYAMAVGALVGGVLQFTVQLPVLWKEGFRYRFSLSFRHEGVRRIARMITPAIVGISAVEINVLINTQLASQLGYTGPMSWLDFAFRIIYLPIGLFGVAIGVVNLKEVSVLAAEANWEELKATVANSVKLTALVALPSTAGLLALAAPIVRILFEHGAFSASDTMWTAYALSCYSVGLTAYSLIKIYVPTFYALGDARTPVRIAVIGVGVNLFVNGVLFLTLPTEYRYLGLALGTSVSVMVNCLLLARGFSKRLGPLARYSVSTAILKSALAAGGMAALVYILHWRVSEALGAGFLEQGIALGLSIATGMTVYFVLALLLNIEEARLLLRRILR